MCQLKAQPLLLFQYLFSCKIYAKLHIFAEIYSHFIELLRALSGAARDAGVQDKMFGVFHDAGYKGLYGGLGVDAIKAPFNRAIVSRKLPF